jgi:hypothetical protein
MEHLEVSCAVRRFFKSLGFKGLMYSTRYSCQMLLKVQFFFGRFSKKYPNFMKICPVGAELFHAEGRTDRQT